MGHEKHVDFSFFYLKFFYWTVITLNQVFDFFFSKSGIVHIDA